MYPVQRNGKQWCSDHVVVLLGLLDVPTSVHKPLVVLLEGLKGSKWTTASDG